VPLSKYCTEPWIEREKILRGTYHSFEDGFQDKTCSHLLAHRFFSVLRKLRIRRYKSLDASGWEADFRN
jgi:hypothetical protein